MAYLPLVGKIEVVLVVHADELVAQLRQVAHAPVAQLDEHVVRRDPRRRVRTSAATNAWCPSTVSKRCTSPLPQISWWLHKGNIREHRDKKALPQQHGCRSLGGDGVLLVVRIIEAGRLAGRFAHDLPRRREEELVQQVLNQVLPCNKPSQLTFTPAASVKLWDSDLKLVVS